jgi:hypothetical protein
MVWVGVRVAVGSGVGVSEGALVRELINVGSSEGAVEGEGEAVSLHPVIANRIKTNKGTIIFVSRLNPSNTIPPNYYPLTSTNCGVDIIAHSVGFLVYISLHNLIAPIIYKREDF